MGRAAALAANEAVAEAAMEAVAAVAAAVAAATMLIAAATVVVVARASTAAVVMVVEAVSIASVVMVVATVAAAVAASRWQSPVGATPFIYFRVPISPLFTSSCFFFFFDVTSYLYKKSGPSVGPVIFLKEKKQGF